MTPDRVSELSDTQEFKLAAAFIKGYFAGREGLRQLEILRLERALQGDYAQWIAANVLGLELARSAVQKGSDATDIEGLTYQIKSRIVRSLSSARSFDIVDPTLEFDFLIGILFSPTFDILAIVRLSRPIVLEKWKQTGRSYRIRWNKVLASDHAIEFLYKAEPVTVVLDSTAPLPTTTTPKRRI